MRCKVRDLRGENKPRYLMVISGIFDDDLYERTLDIIGKYITNKEKYSGITIFITSLGGNAHIGLALYDMLKSLNTSIYTVALGECASAATLVFSLGEKRFIGKNTICLMHSVSIGNDGYSNARDFSELYSRMKLYNAKMLGVYRNTENVTDEYLEFIDDLFVNTKEVTLNSTQLLEYNFATDLYESMDSVV